jgi:hypothetical protein
MKSKSNLTAALILIALGTWFLIIQLVPGVQAFAYGASTWPVPIIGIGLFLALVGLVTGSLGLLIPASIVTGIGGLLYWQNATGNWESWAYAWALIGVFVGVGITLVGLLERRRAAVIGGGWTIISSLIVFAIFASFLGDLNLFGRFWPVLLIALGVLVLFQAVFFRK